jgi:hypothetical protein
MNIASSEPNDPGTASLVEAIRASRAAVADFRDALRHVNGLALHEAAAPVVEAAESILAQQEQRAEPTIADDAANLRALFSRLPIPRADADLGPLPGLKTLRGARGVLYQEFDEVLRAARGLGWRASDPALPEIGGAAIAKDQSLARMLETLVARMETVEQLLDESVTPEGEPAPGRTTIQIALVRVFIKTVKIELALAKLGARVKAAVDFSVLGSAVENICELTTDFLATVRGISGKMTPALREASERLRLRVRRVASGFKTVVGKVASGLSRVVRQVPCNSAADESDWQTRGAQASARIVSTEGIGAHGLSDGG